MNNSGMRRKEVYNRTVDLYAILGLDKGASAGQISKAYKSLAKRYHPDRSVGNDKDENTEKFKKICEAYSILSDQRRRRQYDVYGGNPSEMEDSAYEMEGQNSITRVFGAVWSAFGAVLHTEIGASTLIQAQELCARSAAAAAAAAAAAVSGGEEGKPSTTKINEANKEGKKVTELKLGHGITGSTGRQDSVYYVLRLSEAEAANGVIVSCNSSNKSRFKLICFDHEGAVRYVQESSLTSDKKFTVANMFLVPFETIISVAPPPVGGGLLDHPQIFERVRNMTAEARTLRAGEHLLCVYGDNWLNNTPYTLTALLAELSSGVVQAVKDVDAELREKKKEVEELEDEYIRAKMVFDRVSDRVAEQTAVTEGLINKREVAFNIFIEESLRKYSNKHVGLGGRLPTAAAVPAAAMPVANMALDTPQGVEVAGGKAEHQRAGSLTSSNSDGATVGASEIGQDVKESVPPATGGKGGGKERVKGATAAGENVSGNGAFSPLPMKRSSFSFFSALRRGGGGKGEGQRGEGEGRGSVEGEQETQQQEQGPIIAS